MSGRENALAALATVLGTAFSGTGVTWLGRNQATPEPQDVAVSDPAALVAALRDGDAQEPQPLLGDPPLFDHVQTPVLEIVAVHPDAARRACAMDAALCAAAAALVADVTLGGKCAFVQAHPPDLSNIGDTDAPFGTGAEVPIDLLFTTNSPIG